LDATGIDNTLFISSSFSILLGILGIIGTLKKAQLVKTIPFATISSKFGVASQFPLPSESI
jgi:hypothetical protein